jgi:glycerate 2-kinase
MIIKNFKSLALNKERRIALEIVEAGLSALDYEKIDFKKYLSYPNEKPNKQPESSDRIESTRITRPNNNYPNDNRIKGFGPDSGSKNIFGQNSGKAFGQHSGIYLLGFGKGSAKIANILRKRIKFKEIYVIDVESPDKHGFKTDKRGSFIDQSMKRYQHESVRNPHKSVGTKYPHQSVLDPHKSVVFYFKGTHPLPSRKNFLFTKKIVERFQGRLTKDDLVIVLVCGGGSAMLVYPKINLKKYIQVNQELLKSGANIYEINTIRKHLDLVKGGGLLKIIYPAKVISFIFSDVPGNDLSFIASGPTVKDKTEIADALKIIKKYKLKSIRKEDLIETPKEEKYFKNVKNILALSNLTALRAMKEKAESLGLKAKILTDNLKGDVKEVAKFLFQEIKRSKEKVLIVGGETTVKVKGKGKGGRNQELVLWFLKYTDLYGSKTDNTDNKNPRSSALDPCKSAYLIISINSDGWDNTEFAGAIGDKLTLEKAEKLKLDIDKFLENNDSFHFFEKTKDGIITGRLPVNVSDLIILYRAD